MELAGGMRPTRREVDDLLLMDAKDRVDASGDQQGQVSIRAKPAIAGQHVAHLKHGMKPRHLPHLMGPQRRGEDGDEQTRPGMEERQDLGHREAATRLLPAGLTEVLLQLGGVRHGEGGAIGEEDAMAVPATVVVVGDRAK